MRKILFLSLLLTLKISFANDSIQNNEVVFDSIKNQEQNIKEVVISGTLKEVSKLESAVPIEVYAASFFKKNPSPTLFSALANVNGVRPQLNCNVCNTGDIHINGMEGGNTMILIDGMPIVSGLSTVYGLFGIPTAMIERVEIVKGPASTLYGSEAVAGLVNVITKNPLNAPKFSLDMSITTYAESDNSFTGKFNVGKKATSLIGLNFFYFNTRFDKNKDNFTDLTLQKRVSFFNKWSFKRKNYRLANFAIRYIWEDRLGGEMQWNKKFRGGDSIYAENIFTNRVELFGNYELPTKEKFVIQYSYNYHHQNSVYGNSFFLSKQHVAFTQLTWNKIIKQKHDILMGTSLRYIFYDDNTPITQNKNNININQPSNSYLPGVFVQYEYEHNPKHKLIIGLRYDYNTQHGSILTPRINYKFSPNLNHQFRFSIGNGYRVVNVFSEDHAALTGARETIIKNNLKPERSWNFNFNYTTKAIFKKGFMNFDASLFYTYFSNRIVGDFISDPNKIIFDNLKGHGTNYGFSLNTQLLTDFGLDTHFGFTFMNIYSVNKDSLNFKIKTQQIQTPKFTANWTISYTIKKIGLRIDYSGNLTSPMLLPTVPFDFRSPTSPYFSIQNIQLSKQFKNGIEIYTGAKNLLNFIPKNPILRAFDPFDKNANDAVNNPNGYTFDPTYNYAQIQGINGFLGIRYTLK